MRRLLIVGCGDVGMRLVALARGRDHAYSRVFALTRDAAHCAALRAAGAVPVLGDLDQPHSLAALAGLAQDVVHLAPPPSTGATDTRTAHLIAALGRRRGSQRQQRQQRHKSVRASLPQHFVYISTSGVYGDCGGALVAETQPARPQTARATRRVDAEQRLRAWGARCAVAVSILRVPGIYAANRLPIERLKRGTPALREEEDSYVNHVHADDLARLIMAALMRAAPGRAYNASDDAPQKMGEYFDLVADRFGLPRPPRLARNDAQGVLPQTLLSFMNESRRLTNLRIKQELRFRLRYPSVQAGIGIHPLEKVQP